MSTRGDASPIANVHPGGKRNCAGREFLSSLIPPLRLTKSLKEMMSLPVLTTSTPALNDEDRMDKLGIVVLQRSKVALIHH